MEILVNTDKYKYKINWLNKFLKSVKKTTY